MSKAVNDLQHKMEVPETCNVVQFVDLMENDTSREAKHQDKEDNQEVCTDASSRDLTLQKSNEETEVIVNLDGREKQNNNGFELVVERGDVGVNKFLQIPGCIKS